MSSHSAHRFNIDIQFTEAFQGLPPTGWIKDIVSISLKVANAIPESSVGVVIAGDDIIQGLNREHRGLDEITDVLAFSFTHEGEYYGEPIDEIRIADMPGFELPPNQVPSLGEVIISFPQTIRQSNHIGHSVEQELATLLVHGILHLMGYDHMDQADEVNMKTIERRALSEFKTGVKGNQLNQWANT